MNEKSQIDAMRAAIRGDLERSRQHLQPGPVVHPREQVEPEPSPDDETRPGFLSSLFKRG
jgi:hypothetical protein